MLLALKALVQILRLKYKKRFLNLERFKNFLRCLSRISHLFCRWRNNLSWAFLCCDEISLVKVTHYIDRINLNFFVKRQRWTARWIEGNITDLFFNVSSSLKCFCGHLRITHCKWVNPWLRNIMTLRPNCFSI